MLVANSPSDAAALSRGATAERLSALATRRRAETFSGAELPFFFESEIGRAYLTAGAGRAIARGEPSESCPAFGVALQQISPEAAAQEALNRCLANRAADTADRCGCRLLAAGSILFGEREEFAHARGVNARLISLEGAFDVTLVAEQKLEERPAADLERGVGETVWLLGPSGPAAAVELSPDGDASLIILTGPSDALQTVKTYTGRWDSEGYRRGRIATQIGVRDEQGRRAVLLIGYEPEELARRQAELIAAARRLL
ncbi:MAG: hypothetical protein AAF661_06435 [Pseudomonadota bacterium]